ncbi:MAG: hypothetical protein JW953_21555 [Anaerolineae bacterium]|nr:hypothetical protein [Anaerolineae bacterium]
MLVTVLDRQTGQPLAQAVVEAGGAPAAQAAVVPAAGTFAIKLTGYSLGLIPRICLKAAAPGFLPTEVSAFVPWWQKQTKVIIRLEPTRIEGQVVDASTGIPVAAAIYAGKSAALSAPAQPTPTDGQGYFELFYLEPPVLLQVEAAGYKAWQTRLEAETLYANPPPLVVDLVSQDLVGVVSDAWTGSPVPAIIYLTDNAASPKGLRQITANNQGHFEATRLEPPLTVQVEAPGYETWQTEVAAMALTTGNPAHKLAVSLVPRTTAGILHAADTNEPLAGLGLSAGADDRRQTATTDAAGRFEFYRLQPGDSIMVEGAEGYLPLETVFNNETELNLSLQPRQAMVLVQDSFANQPVAGATVTFDQTLTATTNAQGQAVLARIPAAGQISVAPTGYRPATVDYQGTESINVVISPTALQGVVRGSDTGQPLPQATLYLGQTILRANDQGHFRLDLPDAPASLMVKSAGYHRAYGQLSQTGVFTDGPPPFSGVEGHWLVAVPCAEAPAQPGPPCLDFVLNPFQVKAIYVPLHYLRSREAMLRYLDFIQATELNALVVDVKGDFGFIGWRSQVEMVATVGADEWWTNTWMPLDELIAEAQKRNIYTIARFVVFKDNPLAHGKPEWAAVLEDGAVWLDGEELGWANPFKEEVWDYNIALAQEIAAFGFDELNFDYLRFPSDGDVGAIVYEEENTLETRTAAIKEFVQRLTEALRPSGVFVSADVFGLTIWVKPESDMKIGQRVMDIAPYVDYLAPMVYPSTFIPGNLGYDNPSAEPYGIVYRSQRQAEERVPPYVKVRPWLQGYWYSLEEMRLLKQAAIDAPSTGWSWWNAGGKYDNELFEPAIEE